MRDIGMSHGHSEGIVFGSFLFDIRYVLPISLKKGIDLCRFVVKEVTKLRSCVCFLLTLDQQISEEDERQPTSISEDASDQRKQDETHLPKSEVTCDESKQDGRQLPTLDKTCANAKKDDGHLPISEVTCNDTKQRDGQLPISEVTCSDNSDDAACAILSTAGPITENFEEHSAIVTPRNVRTRSQKRLLFKQGRKRWDELKKRKPPFVVGKKVNTRLDDRKGLISKQPVTEATTSSEGNYMLWTAELINKMLKLEEADFFLCKTSTCSPQLSFRLKSYTLSVRSKVLILTNARPVCCLLLNNKECSG